MKAIRFADVLPGDVVQQGTIRLTVEERRGFTSGSVTLYGAKKRSALYGKHDTPIVILHRPLRDGATREQLFRNIALRAGGMLGYPNSSVSYAMNALEALRQAIDHFELSASLEPERRKEQRFTADGEVGPDYPVDTMPLG